MTETIRVAGRKGSEYKSDSSIHSLYSFGFQSRVVSRQVSHYVVNTSNTETLFEQHEAETAFKWMNESISNGTIQWKYSKYMTNNGNCKETSKLVIGQVSSPKQMRACFQ